MLPFRKIKIVLCYKQSGHFEKKTSICFGIILDIVVNSHRLLYFYFKYFNIFM